MATISTSPKRAYVYDSASDTWFPIGGAAFSAGSASAPSISFSGDSNTGLWSPTADTIAASTGGTERMRITSAGNVGIGTTSPVGKLNIAADASNAALVRLDGWNGTNAAARSEIESVSTSVAGDAALVFRTRTGADATQTERMRIDSSGNVGIGTNTPTAQLDMSSDSLAILMERTYTSSGTGSQVYLRKARGTFASPSLVSSGDDIGRIVAQGYDGTTFVTAAQITAGVDGTPGTNDMPGRLVFSTTADGASSLTERMRITSAGNVGIGTNSPGAKLDVRGNTGSDSGVFVTGVAGIAQFQQRRVNGTGSTAVSSGDIIGDQLFVGWDGSSFLPAARIRATVDSTPGTNDMPGRLSFLTTADGGTTENERMRIDNAGLITGTGTSLGAWTAYTPTLGGTGWAIGNGTAVGAYCQIGKVVIFRVKITFGSTSTFGGAANPTITLPLAAGAGRSLNAGLGSIFFDQSTGISYTGTSIFDSTTIASPRRLGTNGEHGSVLSTLPFTWTTSDELGIQGTYEAA